MTIAPGRVEVDAAPNGGIEAQGSNRSDVRIRAKVVAQARSVAEARALAGEVRIETSGVVRAVGPPAGRDRSFWVSYELSVPEATDLRLETMNGGIALHGVKGTVEFKTLNGGVTIDSAAGSVRGRIDRRLDVELGRGGPTVRAVTTNGGVTIHRR